MSNDINKIDTELRFLRQYAEAAQSKLLEMGQDVESSGQSAERKCVQDQETVLKIMLAMDEQISELSRRIDEAVQANLMSQKRPSTLDNVVVLDRVDLNKQLFLAKALLQKAALEQLVQECKILQSRLDGYTQAMNRNQYNRILREDVVRLQGLIRKAPIENSLVQQIEKFMQGIEVKEVDDLTRSRLSDFYQQFTDKMALDRPSEMVRQPSFHTCRSDISEDGSQSREGLSSLSDQV